MERVTIRMTKSQRDEVDELVDRGEFPNRSEAIRTLVRKQLNERDDDDSGDRPWAKI